MNPPASDGLAADGAAHETATTSAAVTTRIQTVLALLGLLAVAAVLRLPFLDTRGTWDADQGHDMLVLRSLVRDGIIPLLGPPTSIGDVHHGALYYFILAPAAALTGGDSPLAVVAFIALAGIAAVAVTWWLARDIGGPVAGLVAGIAMAVSTSAVDESTFIWNPNLIALSSAVALAGAWRAWTTRRPAWWLVAAVGTAVTMQCHVLGVTLLPIVGALAVADARSRRPAQAAATSGASRPGLAIIAVSFLPLVIHELTSDFSEINAALDYLRSGGDHTAIGPVARLFVIGARVLSWPLTGLITDGAVAAVIAVIVVVLIAIQLARHGAPRERQAARWLGLGLVWTVVFLTFASPSLATVVPGLPNDHYHAFADPMVFVLLGLGAGALWRAGSTSSTGRTVKPARIATVLGLGLLLAWNLGHQLPAVDPDGGFPAADRAAERIVTASGGGPLVLRSQPVFKSTEAYLYPLVRIGAPVRAIDPKADSTEVHAGESLVVICDALFVETIGAPCGGPAEALIAPPDRYGEPIDRFEAAPGRTISVYAPLP